MKLGPPSDLALKGTFYSVGLYVDYSIFKDVLLLNLIALLLFSKSLMLKKIDISMVIYFNLLQQNVLLAFSHL